MLKSIFFATILFASGTALAVDSWSSGTLRSVSVQAGGGAVTTLSNVVGVCGSEFFFLPDGVDFKNLYALFLTVFALDQGLNLHITDCDGATNIVSDAYVIK